MMEKHSQRLERFKKQRDDAAFCREMQEMPMPIVLKIFLFVCATLVLSPFVAVLFFGN